MKNYYGFLLLPFLLLWQCSGSKKTDEDYLSSLTDYIEEKFHTKFVSDLPVISYPTRHVREPAIMVLDASEHLSRFDKYLKNGKDEIVDAAYARIKGPLSKYDGSCEECLSKIDYYLNGVETASETYSWVLMSYSIGGDEPLVYTPNRQNSIDTFSKYRTILLGLLDEKNELRIAVSTT